MGWNVVAGLHSTAATKSVGALT